MEDIIDILLFISTTALFVSRARRKKKKKKKNLEQDDGCSNKTISSSSGDGRTTTVNMLLSNNLYCPQGHKYHPYLYYSKEGFNNDNDHNDSSSDEVSLLCYLCKEERICTTESFYDCPSLGIKICKSCIPNFMNWGWGYECDSCNSYITSGSSFCGCRACDFDICDRCFQQQRQGPGRQKQKLQHATQEEAPILHIRNTTSSKEKELIVCDYWLRRIVEKNGLDLKDAPYHIRNNKKIVMRAVQKDGNAFQFASPELRKDKQVKLAAIQQLWNAIAFSPELQNDKDFASASVPPDLQNYEEIQHYYWLSRIEDKYLRGTQVQTILGSAPSHIRNDKKIVMAAVKKDGNSLQYASPDLQMDREVVLAAVGNNFQFTIRKSDITKKDIIAVQNSGRALEYASPELKNDRQVVITAVQAFGRALRYASPELQNDPQVVLLAIQNDPSGNVLQYASPNLRDNKAIVSAAVNIDGRSLQYASLDVQRDKEVVKAAVRNDRQALEYAAPELQNDMELDWVYMHWEEKVKVNGLDLQHAPEDLRNNKQIIMEAIYSHPNAIKYASGNLKRDPDLLIAAGMFDERHHVDRSTLTSDTKNTTATETLTMAAKKITMSTRFSLDQSSKSEATNFTKLLKDHEYIQNGNFKIYAPNAFDKKTCDPNWTDFNHPCRGTYDTCQFESKLKTGRPTDECCWRYSYRYHLQAAKDTGGFMIQLVESNTSILKKEPPKLGNGQVIERDMAQAMKVKVFFVYRPTNDRFGGCEWYFDMSHVETVIVAIKAWYDEGCQDMSECIVRP